MKTSHITCKVNNQVNLFISEEIIIRDDGLGWDIGYPWAVELENGNVLIVYYFYSEDSVRHIAASEVEVKESNDFYST